MDKISKDLPHYFMTVGTIEADENIFITSLVFDPATEMKMQVFSKQSEQVVKNHSKFAQMPATTTYERLISGVWFMPDTKYYRNVNGLEFTVSMTKDELKKALVNHLKNDLSNYFDCEHNGDFIMDLISLEYWIIESKDTKSPIMGYSLQDLGYDPSTIPLGTVMKTVYVKDETFFKDMILTGKVTGYSIEGFFNFNKQSEDMISEQFSNKNMFNALGLEQSTGTVVSTLGNLVFSAKGITMNDTKVEEGEFVTKTGFKIVVRKGTVVDFGFNTDAAPTTVVPATTAETTAIVAPAAENASGTNQVATDVIVTDAAKEAENAVKTAELEAKSKEDNIRLITEKDTLIADLKKKLEEETKAKEELIKASPVPKTEVTAPTVDMTKFIVRSKNGVEYLIPKK